MACLRFSWRKILFFNVTYWVLIRLKIIFIFALSLHILITMEYLGFFIIICRYSTLWCPVLPFLIFFWRLKFHIYNIWLNKVWSIWKYYIIFIVIYCLRTSNISWRGFWSFNRSIFYHAVFKKLWFYINRLSCLFSFFMNIEFWL